MHTRTEHCLLESELKEEFVALYSVYLKEYRSSFQVIKFEETRWQRFLKRTSYGVWGNLRRNSNRSFVG